MSHLTKFAAAVSVAGLLVLTPFAGPGSSPTTAAGPVLSTLSTGGQGLRPQTAIPVAAAGVTYKTFDGVAFRPDANNDGSSNYVTGGGISPAAGGWFGVRLDVPQGSRITELAWYVTDNSTTANLSLYLYRFDQSGVGGIAMSTFISSGNSSGIQTLVTMPNFVVDNTNGSYILYAASVADPSLTLFGVRVGYIAASPSFYPIAPARVYDSRWATAGGAVGLISPTQSRLISVADGRSGAGVTHANLVPLGAKAITFNITVTGTLGRGWLALTPGNLSVYSSSTINYFGAGQTLANGGVVTIDPSTRQVRVFCDGNAGTAFIIDVTGYYL